MNNPQPTTRQTSNYNTQQLFKGQKQPNHLLQEQHITYANTHRYSQLEYIPYQATRIQYEQKEVIEKVPVQKTRFQYKEVKKKRSIPKQKIITDYQILKKQIVYLPTYIPQTKIQYIPIQVQTSRIQYVPYSRQIVHMQNNQKKSDFEIIRPSSNYKFSTPEKNSKQKQFETVTTHIFNSGRPSSEKKYSVNNISTPVNQLSSKHFDFTNENKRSRALYQVNQQHLIKQKQSSQQYKTASFGSLNQYDEKIKKQNI